MFIYSRLDSKGLWKGQTWYIYKTLHEMVPKVGISWSRLVDFFYNNNHKNKHKYLIFNSKKKYKLK